MVPSSGILCSRDTVINPPPLLSRECESCTGCEKELEVQGLHMGNLVRRSLAVSLSSSSEALPSTPTPPFSPALGGAKKNTKLCLQRHSFEDDDEDFDQRHHLMMIPRISGGLRHVSAQAMAIVGVTPDCQLMQHLPESKSFSSFRKHHTKLRMQTSLSSPEKLHLGVAKGGGREGGVDEDEEDEEEQEQEHEQEDDDDEEEQG